MMVGIFYNLMHNVFAFFVSRVECVRRQSWTGHDHRGLRWRPVRCAWDQNHAAIILTQRNTFSIRVIIEVALQV
jgi:hypothetical protein